MRFFSYALLFAACIVWSLPGEAAGTGHDVRTAMIPHKALYDIKMVSRHSGAPVVNISGQMFFEGKLSCEAWTTDHRFKLLYEYADSPPMHITTNFSTYESLDGTDFSFTSRRERDGEVLEELRGHASRREDGTGQAVHSLPAGLTFDLPPGSLFPVAHTERLLERIGQKEKIFAAVVFDGSDTEGPVEISAFVGKAPPDIKAVVPPSGAIDGALLAPPARMVRLAFFPLSAPGPEADYEMDILLHDNGVISDMLVDYGEFSITQKLRALEPVAPPACKGEKQRVP